MPAPRPLARFDSVEILLCRTLNQSTRHQTIRRFFAGVSRLGDGPVWYTLMGALVLNPGWKGAVASLQMGLTALVGIALAWLPGLSPLLLPLVLLIALSRVVLGLHYPSDGLVGGIIGYGLARLSLWLYPAATPLQMAS
ncbi:phosphatase PAP2 family protein [Alkalilimnicola ehrlichii MLHE-1]|uniref:phosphatase PAP2 family protein n=1 Tax=Alkalilimnicola ehrlichii TaxID=351052 RepID=UPI000673F45F|nr:phosphatase PAP2 family protein [Alkalilimnicola ehrlichii]